MLSYHTAFSPYPYKTTLHCVSVYTPWSDEGRNYSVLYRFSFVCSQFTGYLRGHERLPKIVMQSCAHTAHNQWIFFSTILFLCVCLWAIKGCTLTLIPTFKQLSHLAYLHVSNYQSHNLLLIKSPHVSLIANKFFNVNSIFWCSRLSVLWDLATCNYIIRKFHTMSKNG